MGTTKETTKPVIGLIIIRTPVSSMESTMPTKKSIALANSQINNAQNGAHVSKASIIPIFITRRIVSVNHKE